MLVTELAEPLAQFYQDCEDSLLQQLRNFPEEIAAAAFGFAAVNVRQFPDVVFPKEWTADDGCSPGLAERLAAFLDDVVAGRRQVEDLPEGPLRDDAARRLQERATP